MKIQYKLWFDVGFKRYTTGSSSPLRSAGLWFDVGFKRYTTAEMAKWQSWGCGLM